MSFNQSGSKYLRPVPCITDGKIDVYAVLDAFNVTCPARQHAIKKLLCSGIRGKGDVLQDLREAADAADRAVQMEAQRQAATLPAADHSCPSCVRLDLDCTGSAATGFCEGYLGAPTATMYQLLCNSCSHDNCAKGEYPATKDGGCEGYISNLRERILDAKQEAPKSSINCADCQHPDCLAAGQPHTQEECNQYQHYAKQNPPTAAVPPTPHTDPATNCKDCGNAACSGMGRNLTCDQGCERFTPKAATWTRYEIWQKIETENSRSKAKHGMWQDTSERKQVLALQSEYTEWFTAFIENNIYGEHGEIAELTQLANLCFRRIQFLTGEADA